MRETSYRISGVAPLLCHNAQLSDPLNEWSKALARVTSKRKKTEDDHLEIARLEFHGGLYLVEGVGPVIPAANLERMLRDAAAKTKQGKQVQAGLIVVEDAPIEYEGPRDAAKLWSSDKFFNRQSCKIGQQRVIRTRPCFSSWELKFTVNYDEQILDDEKIDEFVELAGRIIGLGDWRPKHGRFEVLS